MEWRFGVAGADITPDRPQWMSGMGYRVHPSTGVYSPLEAFALYLTDGRTEAVLLTADLISFPADMVMRLRKRIAADTGIPAGHMIFSASHSHDTPRLNDDIVLPGQTDPKYVAWLETAIAALPGAARKAARPGAMSFSRVRADVGVNRRRWDPASGSCIHAPNPEGAHDRAADTRWITDKSGELIASLTSYGCHATACGQYELGGDFPGYFRSAMRKRTAAPALWCAGCGANVRPWFTGDLKSYGGGTPEAARQMGTKHAANVLAGRRGAMELPLDRLSVSRKLIRLPLQPASSYEQFVARTFAGAETISEAMVRDAYEAARKLASVPFEVVVLSPGRDHHLVYWAGEVCTEIGLALKDLCPGQIVTPHGYANGLAGYIPARHMFPQGGYEVERSCGYFKLPAPFVPDVEDRIHRTTMNLIARHR